MASPVSLEQSIPGAPLTSIVLTEELRRRPARGPEYEKENRALASLVRTLADSPSTILQTLAETVLELLEAHSAGLSLLTKDATRFYWAAIAGAWQPHLGGGTPRDFGPCGDVLNRNAPMLFTHWERRYPYLGSALPLADEGLLVPFHVNGTAVGTIWAIAHDQRRRFDAEDLRLLESLSRVASAAYQAVASIKNLELEVAARQRAELEIRQLVSGLEAQVRARTSELERSEAFLAKVQQISNTGGFSWWPATGKILYSDQMYSICEIDPAVPLTRELARSRIHPDDLPAEQEAIGQAVSAARDMEYACRLIMPDQRVKYVHSFMQATRDAQGELVYVGALQDVTQRRLSELALNKVRAELEHVARVTAFGALSASIAHEVKQPLSGIITNAGTCLRMLAADPPNVEGARQTAMRTIRDGERATEVITRLRGLFAHSQVVTERLDLNKAIEEVIALSRGDLQRARVIVRLDLGQNLPDATGDRIQLQQVILNLVMNASNAMSGVEDRPRELTVRSVLDEGGGIRVSVHDTGVGFKPQLAERLFEPFFTTKSGGMGIGLSVSRSIIERHQGRLWATCNQDHGATFVFCIPREARELTDTKV